MASVVVGCGVEKYDTAGNPIKKDSVMPTVQDTTRPVHVVGVIPDSKTQTAPTSTQPPAATAKTQAPATPAPAPSEDQGVVVAPTLANVDTTITIRANGPELLFDPGTITLKQGTRVRLRFTNMGSFAHNFVLVKNDSDLDEIIQRAHDATDNVPMSLKAKMVTWSTIAQPTRTVETSFVVPAPGEYTYVCLVEGHANTMVGRLKSTP